MNFEAVRIHVFNTLQEKLSIDLTYHSYLHTLDVLEAVERTGMAEGYEGEDLLLLRTAALFHDIGFTEVYQNHEERGVKIARETLPDYGYSKEQIERIGGMIMATKIPQSPKSHIEQVMCDADLDYLGRDDFHSIANSFREELKRKGIKDFNDEEWYQLQVTFIGNHTYFTKSAQKWRNKGKQARVDEFQKKLDDIQK